MATKALLIVALLAAPAMAQPMDPYEPDLAPPMSVTPDSWQPQPEPPPILRRLHVAVGVGLRFTNLDAHDSASKMQLLEYGWASARSPTMGVFAAEVEYLLAPIVDIGLAASTAHSDHAAGIDWNDRVLTTTTTIAAVAKVHWALQRPFIPEPRVDLGFVRRSIEVHAVGDADTLPFVRAGMDWRLGTRRAGVQVSAGYILTGRASDGKLDPAVGGLDVGLAPYFRW